jgi:S1-C subfamily serine protease
MLPIVWFTIFNSAAIPQMTATINTPLFTAEQQWSMLEATVRLSAGDDRPPYSTGICVATRNGAVYILTANHSVPPGEVRKYDFFNRQTYPRPTESSIDYETVLRVPESDFALVKVVINQANTGKVRLARFADKPTKFPHQALGIGCPGGAAPMIRLDSILSRQYVKREVGNAFFWETAVGPSGGMSGGPLFDRQGRVLGICSAVSASRGYFTHLDEILAALKRHGHAWIYE